MGLFKALALFPLAPIQGVVGVARQLQDQAERQMFDAQAVIEELAYLQASVDRGQITEEEYLEAENELLDWLEAIEEAR